MLLISYDQLRLLVICFLYQIAVLLNIVMTMLDVSHVNILFCIMEWDWDMNGFYVNGIIYKCYILLCNNIMLMVIMIYNNLILNLYDNGFECDWYCIFHACIPAYNNVIPYCGYCSDGEDLDIGTNC
ncbi:hypothetical protein ACJX0J_028948 [Zea mays]